MLPLLNLLLNKKLYIFVSLNLFLNKKKVLLNLILMYREKVCNFYIYESNL